MKKSKELEVWRSVGNKINMACICVDNARVRDIVQAIDTWSYMHRVGNGEISDKETRKLINKALKALRDI